MKSKMKKILEGKSSMETTGSNQGSVFFHIKLDDNFPAVLTYHIDFDN